MSDPWEGGELAASIRRAQDRLVACKHAYEDVGSWHFANGWPRTHCPSCFETLDHSTCLECATEGGRQISEGERRNAWGK